MKHSNAILSIRSTAPPRSFKFVRELEQGKETVRMDKVNQALAMFGAQAVSGRKDD